MIKFPSQDFGLNIWNVFKDKSWCFSGGIFENVIEFDYIWTTIEGLEDFDFSVLFLNANWLQYFDDTLLIVL